MSERKRIPVGTLVRVRDSALNENIYADQNREYVAEHGYLHMVINNTGDANRLTFKSIATGHEHRFFFEDEVEEHNDE